MEQKKDGDPLHAPELRHDLLDWWQVYGRHDIPWKLGSSGRPPEEAERLDPYPIWVAEVMLQQTRLEVVLPYWRRWMAAFPCAQALAAADEHRVLLLWQGLGYYSRARRLRQGARQLLERHDAAVGPGAWISGPDSLEGWMALPGIGRSTAGGILSTAFNLPAAILDGNALRVLARLTAHPAAAETAAGPLLAAE